MGVFAVVGCSSCQALWVVDTDSQTSGCPRCGTRHQVDRLKEFVRTPDETKAREVRAAILAKRQGEEAAFAEIEDFGMLAERTEIDVVADADYLAQSGIDPAEVEAAGERATEASGSRDRQTVVEEAIRTLDDPTREAVADRAEESGVSPEQTESMLRRLVREGQASEQDGIYRLL